MSENNIKDIVNEQVNKRGCRIGLSLMVEKLGFTCNQKNIEGGPFGGKDNT